MVKHELVIANLPSWASTFGGARPSASEQDDFVSSSSSSNNQQHSSQHSQRRRPYVSSSYQDDPLFAPYKKPQQLLGGLRDLEELYGDLEEPAASGAAAAAAAKKPTQQELDEFFFNDYLRNSPPPVVGAKKKQSRRNTGGSSAAGTSPAVSSTNKGPVSRLPSSNPPVGGPIAPLPLVSSRPLPSPRFAAPVPQQQPSSVVVFNAAQAEADDIFFGHLRSNSAPSHARRKKEGDKQQQQPSGRRPQPQHQHHQAYSSSSSSSHAPPTTPTPHDDVPIRSSYAIQQQQALASGVPLSALSSSPAFVVVDNKAPPRRSIPLVMPPSAAGGTAKQQRQHQPPAAAAAPPPTRAASAASETASSSGVVPSSLSRFSGGACGVDAPAAGGFASVLSSEVSSEATTSVADDDEYAQAAAAPVVRSKILRTPRGVASRVVPTAVPPPPVPLLPSQKSGVPPPPTTVLPSSSSSSSHKSAAKQQPPMPKQQPLSVARRNNSKMSNDDNDEDTADTRRNLDKRTARIRHSIHFKHHIDMLREANPALTGSRCCRPSTASSSAVPTFSVAGVPVVGGGVNVFVRKRPLFGYESVRQDFDVVSVVNASSSSSRPSSANQLEGGAGAAARLKVDRVVVHNASMHPDMKRMLMKQSTYRCSAAFDEHCSNEDVYSKIGKPLVTKVMQGGIGTILMYGQTGSGKTYTMSGIEERTCVGLFSTPHTDSDVYEVSVKFIELVGKKAQDLLGKKGGEEVRVVDEIVGVTEVETSLSSNDDNGCDPNQPGEGGGVYKREVQVSWRGASERIAKTPNDLLKLIEFGKSRRATEATEVNGTSSRSHAVCQICVTNKTKQSKGVLTLIDCAGSERRNDSLYHSKERQLESAEINASLYALKECIRARMSMGRGRGGGEDKYIPYRASLLTRVLRESFEDVEATLSIIATAAPTATDTEHTMETLKTVATIVGLERYIETSEASEVKVWQPELEMLKLQMGGAASLVPPAKWNHSQLRDFLETANKGMFASCVEHLVKNETGKTVMAMTALRFSTPNGLCPNNLELATELFYKLRDVSENVQRKLEKARKARKGVARGFDG